MSTGAPLLQGYRPEAELLFRPDGRVTQGQFLGSAHRLAGGLPACRYLVNLCEDRGLFTHAFAAVCWNGQTNLLPPSRAPGTVREIARAYADCVLLCDGPFEDIGIPRYLISAANLEAPPWPGPVPEIPGAHAAAIAFTSGSTGGPQPHVKTWRMLVDGAALYAERFLGPAERRPRVNVVATVPPQHMYGLEMSVMLALAGGAAAHVGRPHLPDDVRAALEQVPAPRVLVTTPVHLRALVASGLTFPPLSFAVSATAPLAAALAAEVEQRLGTRVYEIYGCTEAGSMCTRRTLDGERWRPLAGVRLVHHDGITHVTGAHLDAPVSTPDVVEVHADGSVTLLGRSADMVKVAGKRASLSELTGKLLGISGVEDGIVFMPSAEAGHARPAALVVAPGLSEREILDALRHEMDAVFLPRPLRKVDRLPRNSLGKLPREELLALLESPL